MKKEIITSISMAFAFALMAQTAFASGTNNCQPIYGGGQTCVQEGNISINKTVQNPQTNAFVDNLGVNDPKYGPGFQVTFQLTVTNTGSTTLSKVTVRDIFPQFVDFASGPGNFDANSKTLTFDLNDLKPGESRTFNLVGRVVSSDKLPQDQGISCVINQSTATAEGKTSQDNAQFCIEKKLIALQPTGVPGTTKGGLKVFPPQQVTTTPNTGPEMLPLIALLPAGGFGYFLRRKSRIS